MELRFQRAIEPPPAFVWGLRTATAAPPQFHGTNPSRAVPRHSRRSSGRNRRSASAPTAGPPRGSWSRRRPAPPRRLGVVETPREAVADARVGFVVAAALDSVPVAGRRGPNKGHLRPGRVAPRACAPAPVTGERGGPHSSGIECM